jgi:hypothetical protein
MTEIGTWTARRRSRLRLPLLPQTARVELQFGMGDWAAVNLVL